MRNLIVLLFFQFFFLLITTKPRLGKNAKREEINEDEDRWTRYKQKYKLEFHEKLTDIMRKKIFFKNRNFIDEFNRNGNRTFSLSVNRFAHLTNAEFKTFLDSSKRIKFYKQKEEFVLKDEVIPDFYDWRDFNKVSPVKDQLECGSCWAFGAVAALESLLLIRGKNVTLSEQNIVDCSKEFDNQGCMGGYAQGAYEYMMTNGIEKETDYPYKARDQRCMYDGNKSYLKLQGYQIIKSGDDNLMKALYQHGPIVVSIDASHETFRFYSNGVYYDPACSSQDLDHSVLAVGYIKSGEYPHFIIKNSWGREWGEEGFIKILYNGMAHCGVSQDMCVPLLPNI